MSRLIASRKRLLRVRDVQHNQAVAELVSARAQAEQIADNARRIAKVRTELFGDAGTTTGANLAARRELAARLETAGRQLDGALYDANRRVDAREGDRIDANRDREIASRLKDKAQAAREALREKRLQALPSYRRMAGKGTEE
jgi:flagellar biosynthesis chaperone FliJ